MVCDADETAGGFLVDDLSGYAEGLGMEGGLWDEAVGEWYAEETGDASGQAKEEYVPVETGGFAKGEFGSLSDEGGDCGSIESLVSNVFVRWMINEWMDVYMIPIGRGRQVLTVMIEPEQDRQENGKRHRQEYITDTHIPKMDQPTTIRRGKECLTRRQSLNDHIPHMSNMNESGKENNRQRRAIILDEFPHMALEKVAFSNNATSVCEPQNQETDHDGDICTVGSSQFPLSGQDLDTFLKIDECDVETKGVAAESGDVG